MLDKWQDDVLAADGNLCICSGRQVGKSQIIAIKSAEFVVNNPRKRVLIVSITEDQAVAMLEKIVLYFQDNHGHRVARGKDKPTKHRVKLNNGSSIVTKAVGQYGLGVLGGTYDVVVPDEAAYLPEAIWASLSPTLLTTGGFFWLLSTPNTMQGYFFKAYTDSSMGFRTFHVNSEDVAVARPEPQRSIMLAYLAREKARMTGLEYAQQYLAQFLEELGRLFSDDLISSCQTLERGESVSLGGEFFLGVDVAGLGGDEITFEVLERLGDGFFQREHLVEFYQRTTVTVDQILALDLKFNFRKIYVDDGGMGVGVFDQLLVNDRTRRKVVGINNASRSIDFDAKRTKKLFKEDLYFNLLGLMERGQIHLLKDSDIFASLKSIVYEKSKDRSDVRIHGSYSHISEGLIRAAWASRDKTLGIYFEV